MENRQVAVILPAFNEELTIKETILGFFKELPDALFVVVDNNSKDNTSKIVLDTFSEYKIDGKLITEQRQGKGNAIRTAFRVVDADVYIMADADMTYPSFDVHRLIEPIINEDIDMCVGDRLLNGNYDRENKRAFHGFGNRLVKGLVNTLFKANVNDIMSGYRAFSRRFVKNYPILVEGFELETDMTLHALDKRFNIKEVSISYKDRPQGSQSKLSTFSDGFKVLFTIFRIFRYYKPFSFFAVLSLLFAFFSLISAIPVFEDWFRYQYIFHLPLAILATGLGLISIILFSLALILDAIANENRREFEQRILKN